MSGWGFTVTDSISGNVCGRAWKQGNPNGTAAAFVKHWEKSSKEEKKVCGLVDSETYKILIGMGCQVYDGEAKQLVAATVSLGMSIEYMSQREADFIASILGLTRIHSRCPGKAVYWVAVWGAVKAGQIPARQYTRILDYNPRLYESILFNLLMRKCGKCGKCGKCEIY